MFVSRELSADLDLDLYNKMTEVQFDPKYQEYFGEHRTAMQTN